MMPKNRMRLLRVGSPLYNFIHSGLGRAVIAALCAALVFGVLVCIPAVRRAVTSVFAGDETTGETTEPDPTDVPQTVTDADTGDPGPLTGTGVFIDPDDTGSEPQTDEETIDRIVKIMEDKGFTAESWNRLRSFGVTAFDLFVTRFFDGSRVIDSFERGVYSVYCSVFIKEDFDSNGWPDDDPPKLNFPDVTLAYDPSFFPSKAQWLRTYDNMVKLRAKNIAETTMRQLEPVTYRFLTLTGFSDYYFLTAENSIEACFEYAAERSDNRVKGEIISQRRGEAIVYCLQTYTADISDKMSKLVNEVFRNIMYGEYSDLRARFGLDYDYENSQTVKELLDFVKEYAPNLFEVEAKNDYPNTYAALSAAGFSDYRPGPPDMTYRIKQLLKELNGFYRAVTYGLTESQGCSEVYEKEEDLENASPELIAKLTELYSDNKAEPMTQAFYPFHSQVEGFQTIEQWRQYYGRFLPAETVDMMLSKESKYFFTANGKVYTTFDLGFNEAAADLNTLHITSQKDGRVTAEVYVKNSFLSGYYTVEVKEDGGGLRAIGGTFVLNYFDFPQYGGAMQFLYSAMRSFCTTQRMTWVRYDELTDKQKEKAAEMYANPEQRGYRFYPDPDAFYETYVRQLCEYYPEKTVRDLLKNNKLLYEVDGVLLVTDAFEEMSFYTANKLISIEKTSDSSYSMTVTLTELGMMYDSYSKEYTVRISFFDGSPKITGGTLVSEFLTDVMAGKGYGLFTRTEYEEYYQ